MLFGRFTITQYLQTKSRSISIAQLARTHGASTTVQLLRAKNKNSAINAPSQRILLKPSFTVFVDLADPKLLERCQLRATQNQNDALCRIPSMYVHSLMSLCFGKQLAEIG